MEALKHFQSCKETDTSNIMHTIITKFPGKCLKCGHEIPAHVPALYGKGVGLICTDCTITQIGDKALVHKYLKNRELDQIKSALIKECDELAQKIETYRVIDKLEALNNSQERTEKLISDFLTHKIGSDQENKALEDVIRINGERKRIIIDMDEFIKKYIQNKKWRKRVLQETDSQS